MIAYIYMSNYGYHGNITAQITAQHILTSTLTYLCPDVDFQNALQEKKTLLYTL